MFTMFESETVCMMYLLSICFDQVDVFKPATSKEGNSEVYVVCRDFKRVPWVDKYLSGVKVWFIFTYISFLNILRFSETNHLRLFTRRPYIFFDFPSIPQRYLK